MFKISTHNEVGSVPTLLLLVHTVQRLVNRLAKTNLVTKMLIVITIISQ